MPFEPLSEQETATVGALATAQKALARAELSDMLADIRLSFTEAARVQMDCNPWFAEQEETVQTAFRSVLAETEGAEWARKRGTVTWLKVLPNRIAGMDRRIAEKEAGGG